MKQNCSVLRLKLLSTTKSNFLTPAVTEMKASESLDKTPRSLRSGNNQVLESVKEDVLEPELSAPQRHLSMKIGHQQEEGVASGEPIMLSPPLMWDILAQRTQAAL